MRRRSWLLPFLLILLNAAAVCAGRAENAPVEITAALSLTGPGAYYGLPILDGVKLALDEANAAAPASQQVGLQVLDDQSNVGRARDLAKEVCAGPSIAVIGPALTVASLVAGPTYASCGLVSVPATAHGDDVPAAATTFQPVFNGGVMGSALAVYEKYVLGGTRAIVLFRKDGYGQPVADGFNRAARQLGIATAQYGFTTVAERNDAVKAAVADQAHPAIVLGMINDDAVPILVALRRAGVSSVVLAPSAIGGEDFVSQFAKEPEEAGQKGFFTDKVYAASPILFDSANADVLAFASRFRAAYGRDPSWPAVQGYDSARLAIQAALGAGRSAQDVAARRGIVLAAFTRLDGGHAVQGVTGPLWFTPQRRRDQPVRIGLFHEGLFDSAPIQLVPVASPAPEEVASGEVFEALPGQFVRRQRVVYTGIFVNEIPRVDLQRSTFNIDFYLWMRVVENAGPISFDPTDIRFAGLTGGFNRASPSEQRVMPDGTTYRLWHIEGEVRNEFDLRRFPFDQQLLRLSFYNARADASHVVYVLDRGSLQEGGRQILATPSGGAMATQAQPVDAPASVVSTDAFRELTQWQPEWASERRENLVTDSPLGYPKQPGAARGRELSGYIVTIDLQRRVLATTLKTLLPLVIMTIILFSSLYFPHGLVKEKVTVAVTAALSGAVLLTSINTQLGNLGYTIAAEYVFYAFFGLSLLAILCVLVAERLRVAGAPHQAVAVEQWTRIAFIAAVVAVLGGAVWFV